MTAAERRERHRIIHEALIAGSIHSQEDVVRILSRANIRVTQATASRDLDEIGAVRGKDSSGRSTYLLPDSARGASDDVILEVDDAGGLLVLKTRPGAAQLIAARIDRARMVGVVGTIAGDDTIFIAMKQGVISKKAREAILGVASGSSTTADLGSKQLGDAGKVQVKKESQRKSRGRNIRKAR